VGVLIEVNCETDFVARTAEFGDLVRNLRCRWPPPARSTFAGRRAGRSHRERAPHLRRTDGGQGKRPPSSTRSWKASSEVLRGDLPAGAAYIKDDKIKVADLVKEASAKTGENVLVRRFPAFRLGRSSPDGALPAHPPQVERRDPRAAGWTRHRRGGVARLADEIRDVAALGVQSASSPAAANIFRGLAASTPAWTASAPTTWGCWPR